MNVAPSPHSVLETTASKLHRATILIDRLADDYLHGAHGVRYPQFLVLLMVHVLGPTNQQAIADNLAVTRASVSQRVTILAARGLLAVTVDPRDTRAHRVTLTPEGVNLVTHAWAGLDAANSELDVGVDEKALVAQLDTLIDNALTILRARS